MPVGRIPKNVTTPSVRASAPASAQMPKIGPKQWKAIAEIAFPGVDAAKLKANTLPTRKVAEGLWWVGVLNKEPNRDTTRGVLVGKNGMPASFDAAWARNNLRQVADSDLNAFAGTIVYDFDPTGAKLVANLTPRYPDRPESAWSKDGFLYHRVGEDFEAAWYKLGKFKG